MTKPVVIPNTFATQFGDVPASELDSDYTTLALALNDLITFSNYIADTGGPNAYAVNFPSGITVTYTAGLVVLLLAANSNTTSSTLNVNNLGTVPILRPDGSTLQAGDIIAGRIYAVTYNPSGYFQLPFTESPTTVSFLGIVVISSTETGPGIDNYQRIQAALDQPGVFAVMLQGPGPFRVSQPVLMRRPSLRLYSESEGVGSSFCTTVLYNGVATALPVISVSDSMHGCAIQGITINANALAGWCIQVNVSDVGVTNHPKMHDILVEGYTAGGIVVGKNSTTVLGTGSIYELDMQRIYLGGGSAGTIGILLNAQNCEWAHIKGLFCSPTDYAGNMHLNHIFAFAGGLCVMAMASTAASDFAIICNSSQIVINGWRLEERKGIRFNPVGVEGPCILQGVVARGSAVVFGDLTVDFAASGTSALVINGLKTKGSVSIGPTAPAHIAASNVSFESVGGGFVLPAPQGWLGYLHNATTGEFQIRGEFELGPVNAAVTAHAGGGQGSATLLTSVLNLLTTVASANDSVKLPPATGSGKYRYVRNTDNTNAAALFPSTGDQINELGANNALTLAHNTSARLWDTAPGQWDS